MIDITNSKFLKTDNKDTVIFIHGLGLSLDIWKNQVNFFKKSFNVLIYDLYGHGKSRFDNRRPSLEIYSEQLKSLHDFYKIHESILVGFSLGGMIARHFCQEYPQYVKKLVIMNSVHKRTINQQKAVSLRAKKIKIFGLTYSVHNAITRWFTRKYIRDNPYTINKIKKIIIANEKRIYNLSYDVLVNEVDKIISPSPSISCPTLIITSDKDEGNNIEMAKKIKFEIPNSALKIFKNVKHMALIEIHDHVNKTLESFLKNK